MFPYEIVVDCFYNQYGERLLRGTNWVFKFSVIKKDGLNFVRLYFLNYTQYVNGLHNT